jgi:hypothetical protein
MSILEYVGMGAIAAAVVMGLFWAHKKGYLKGKEGYVAAGIGVLVAIWYFLTRQSSPGETSDPLPSGRPSDSGARHGSTGDADEPPPVELPSVGHNRDRLESDMATNRVQPADLSGTDADIAARLDADIDDNVDLDIELDLE